MSRWKGFLYINVYEDLTAKEIGDGRLPTWTFYLPAHVEPGLQKAPAVFPRAKLNRGGHKYKETAPKRPARHRGSSQYLIGTFDPADRFEIIGALSTCKIEDHDPEAQTYDEDPVGWSEAYSQMYVNKGLRVLDGLNNVVSWDDKEVRRWQESAPYQGKEWRGNFSQRSLIVFADPNDGGEKHFYRYGKKGETIGGEKGLCAGCVRRAKERSALRGGFQGVSARGRRFDDEQLMMDDVEATVREVRAKSLAKKTNKKALQRRLLGAPSLGAMEDEDEFGGGDAYYQGPPSGMGFGMGSQISSTLPSSLSSNAASNAKQNRRAHRAQLARQQREEWHRMDAPREVMRELDMQRDYNNLTYDNGNNNNNTLEDYEQHYDAEEEENYHQQHHHQSPRLLTQNRNDEPTLAQPKPRRPVPMLLNQEAHGNHHFDANDDDDDFEHLEGPGARLLRGEGLGLGSNDGDDDDEGYRDRRDGAGNMGYGDSYNEQLRAHQQRQQMKYQKSQRGEQRPASRTPEAGWQPGDGKGKGKGFFYDEYHG